MTSSYSNASILVATFFALSSAFIAEIISRKVPDPYMDEIFHIPQAQAYCSSRWHQWDPKLTTPPGLYLLSIAIHKLIPSSLLKGLGSCSSVSFLRSSNLFLLMILPHIISSLLNAIQQEMKDQDGASANPPPTYLQTMSSSSDHSSKTNNVKPLSIPRDPSTQIAKALQKASFKPKEASQDAQRAIERRKKSRGIQSDSLNFKRTLQSHVMTFLPPLYFFGFLYYTDVGSLVMVLSSLLASKTGNHLLAAGFGGISLLFRQTNVVWLVFIASVSILKELRIKRGLYDPVLSKVPSQTLFGTLFKSISSLVCVLKQIGTFKTILKVLAPYLPVFAAFIAFLKWNGGIVLGDKSNHQPVIHSPQFFYFFVFSTFFSFPTLIQTLCLQSRILGSKKSITRAIKSAVSTRFEVKSFLILILLLGLILSSIHYQTVEHPFLLADNRHYPFYVWRKIIKFHPMIRYLLAPVYLLCISLWFKALSFSRSLIWILGFIISLGLTLVPSPLIEPRYFLIPYMVLRIELAGNFELHPHDFKERKEEEEEEEEEEKRAKKVKIDQETSASQNETVDDHHHDLNHLNQSSLTPLVMEAIWFLLINAITIWLFLNRPFKWENQSQWQRFMW